MTTSGEGRMLTRLFPHLLARGVVAEPAKAFGARNGAVNAKLLEEAFVVLLALKQLGVHAKNPRNYDSAVRVCVVLAVQRGLCHPKGQAPDWVSAMRCVAGYADVNPARLMAWRDHVAHLRAAFASVSAEDVHELCEEVEAEAARVARAVAVLDAEDGATAAGVARAVRGACGRR